MSAHERAMVLVGLVPAAGAMLCMSIIAGCAQRAGGHAHAAPASSGQETVTMFDDRAFADVPLNTNEKHAASPPEPEPGWRGIVIRAPAHVVFGSGRPDSPDGAFARVPLCGLYVLDSATAPASGSIMLVARDLATGEVHRGVIGDEDAHRDEPPPEVEPLDPRLLAGVTVEGYFNPNLAHYLDLPQEAATYAVHAAWGGATSNWVRIELVPAGDAP